MKKTITIPLSLAIVFIASLTNAGDALNAKESTPLTRIVCKSKQLFWRSGYEDYILTLDQLETTEDPFDGTIIDGYVVLDPNHEISFTGDIPFELKVFSDGSLIKKTFSELAEKVDSLESSLSVKGEGSRVDGAIVFYGSKKDKDTGLPRIFQYSVELDYEPIYEESNGWRTSLGESLESYQCAGFVKDGQIFREQFNPLQNLSE